MSMTFAIGGTSVTVPSAIYGSTEVIPSKWQSRKLATDGTPKVSDKGVILWYIKVKFRCNYTQLIAVRDFFKNTAAYSLNAVTFTPDASMNAGAGLGTAVTVNLWQDDIPEPYERPGLFPVTLLFITRSAGTGSPS